MFNKVKSSESVLAEARKGLDNISNVFLTTINNYRNHADEARSQSSEWVTKAEAYRQKQVEADSTAKQLEGLAGEADTLADKLENLFK